jgi:hypothetical protein
MPMIYGVDGGGSSTTSGTPNTELDFFYIAAGASRGTGLQAAYIHGKGSALTAISGITVRVKKWTTTASSAGTAITPLPRDPGYQAAKAACGYSSASVTSGTGGPSLALTIGCGAAGPGGWVAPNADSVVFVEAGSNDSIDLFNSSGTASLVMAASAEIIE